MQLHKFLYRRVSRAIKRTRAAENIHIKNTTKGEVRGVEAKEKEREKETAVYASVILRIGRAHV